MARSAFRRRCNTCPRVSQRRVSSSSSRKLRTSTAASTPRTSAAKPTRSTRRSTKSSRSRKRRKSPSRSGTSKLHTKRTGAAWRTCSRASSRRAIVDWTSPLTSIQIAQKAQIPVEIWHLKTAYKKNWGRMAHVLARIKQARDRGLDVTADIYPYIAGSTGLSACLPPWALEGGTDKMLTRLRDPQTRERLKKEISAEQTEWENIYLGSGGPSGVLIGSVVNRDLEPLQGKRISEIAAEQKKDPLDVVFDLILADRGQTGAIYFMMSEADMRLAMQSPYAC